MAPQQKASPVATALPKAPTLDYSKAQLDVLNALVDGALPSIVTKSAIEDQKTQITVADDEFNSILEHTITTLIPSATKDAIRDFLEYRPSKDPRFSDNFVRTLSSSSRSDQKKLADVFSLMSTRVGSRLLTGYWKPIYDQPASIREAVLQSWASSKIVSLRTLAKTFTTLAQKANCQTNFRLHRLVGYTDTPRDWKAGPGFDYNFLQFEGGRPNQVIETDIVIVGSGCGGGVCAKNLAEAGHKVVVVDKGYYFSPNHLPMAQDAACNYLFDNNGIYLTDDNGCNLSAGSTWGGGGTVNWSVCLKLQDFVRKEWADKGLPFFTSGAFDECMDRVLDFVGAGTDNIRHNHRNQVMFNGAKELGWVACEAPQNTAGKEHYCGQCHLGCASSEKRGPAVTWLPAAAQAGAQFIEGFDVLEVLFEESSQSAIGVKGEWTSRDSTGSVSGPEAERNKATVIIKAKKVIVSGGSIRSPLLLQGSGIKNRHLGSNLHIHPCNFVHAVYKEEARPWEGGIITSYCPEFENLDEKGHGVRLEPTCMVPYAVLSMLAWKSGLDAKLLMLKYPHLNGFIALTRDRDSGRVYRDEYGKPRIQYTVSDYDRDHTLEGIIALAKLCYVTGATEIRPLLPGLEPFIPSEWVSVDSPAKNPDPEFSDPAFKTWLRRLREVGNKPPVTTWSSAHQMGTCRMSAHPGDGVVNELGKVWGTDNLYIADASVFPSASGVNPMITVMAIADWISRGVDRELKASE
ncbi:Fc.00g112660.m01.CDS01 [Cosmosporella sp. VM-42]